MNTALARREPMGLTVQSMRTEEWSVMREQAAMLVKSGFLPVAFKTAEQVLAVMLKARELRIPPMYALSNIAIIGGKPVTGAEVMLALLYRDHGDNALTVVRSDAKVCEVEYRRRHWPAAKRYSFTIEEARQANLVNKDIWKNYPQAMLRARCVSAVARMAFPDSISGLYTPEELGADVTVTDEGETVLAVAPETPALPEAAETEPSSTPTQLQRIAILRRKLALADDDYRNFLDGLYGVRSSTLLTTEQAADFIAKLDAEAALQRAGVVEVETPVEVVETSNAELDLVTAWTDRLAEALRSPKPGEALKEAGAEMQANVDRWPATVRGAVLDAYGKAKQQLSDRQKQAKQVVGAGLPF